MKRSTACLVVIGLVLAACSSGEQSDEAPNGSTGSTTATMPTVADSGPVETSVAPAEVDELLTDPIAGLDELTSYHQEMALTVTGSTADTADTYVRDAWPGLGTSTLMTMTTTTGTTQLLVGDLGRSTFRRAGTDGRCEVRWNDAGAAAEPAVEPAAMLPPVAAAAAVELGTDTREGFEAIGFRIDLQTGETAGTGELWYVAASGLLLSYSLDLVTGGVTRAYRYSVTSIDALGPPTLPTGCDPVLESIPAIDGAANVQRLSNALDYSTTAAVGDVVTFYEQALPPLGWSLVGTTGNDPTRPTLFFENATTGEAASILVEISGTTTWVSVIVRDRGGADHG